MFRLVLLALTDAADGASAARVASHIAARHGAGFAVQHVSGPPRQAGGCILHLPTEEDLAARRAGVEALCRTVMPPGLTADVMLCAGFAHVEILKTARVLEPDLLVLGNQGEADDCRRELSGATSDTALLMAETARCPVLVVPAGAPEPTVPFRRILAATDLSDSVEAVLGFAARLAAREGADLRAFHVLPLAPGAPVPSAEYLSRTLAKARERLEYLGRNLPTPRPMAIGAREGEPAVEILKDARESRADLLVLAPGCYGPEAPAAGRLLAGARCPVLLVGPLAQKELARNASAQSKG